MSVFAWLPVDDSNVLGAVRAFLGRLLSESVVEAVMVPVETHSGRSVQPALVTDPDHLTHANPLMPVLPITGARMVTLLTDRAIPAGEGHKRIAVVMRPCELRAAVELAKLNQLRCDQLLTVGVDCVGTYELNDFERLAGEPGAYLDDVLQTAQQGRADPSGELAYRHACAICDTPTAWNPDISIHTIGVDSRTALLVEISDEALASRLGLPVGADPSEHLQAARALAETRHQRRTQALDEIAARMHANGGSPALLEEFELCQRCHNCTVACPICYCKECLFRTPTFAHEPRRYFGWASRKGAARLPGDAIAFQLTRLTHVTASCVGCGLCTSACPAHIPVDSIFQTVAREIQTLFDYVPGRDIGEALPAAGFRQNEFTALGESQH